MHDLKQSKSILARLLSQENIHVVHSTAAQTASFDLKNRTLTCPVWQDMDGSLYDLLMGHETGHALYTPAEGWHDAVTVNAHPKFKPTLNVIEDARIEKLQKNKYPGLRRSFYLAYSELMRRDFFGINTRREVIEHLNLVDRINLHFKVGSMLGVKFTAEEQKLVDRIENITDWADAVTISQELFDYVKNNEQDKINNMDDLKEVLDGLEDFLNEDGSDDIEEEAQSIPMEAEGEGDEVDEDGQYDRMESSDDYNDDVDSDEGESTEPTSEEISEKIKEILENKREQQGDGDQEEVNSVTDQIFREREKELIEDKNSKIFHVDLPDPIMKNIVLPFAETYSDFSEAMRDSLVSFNKDVRRFSDKNVMPEITTIESLGKDMVQDFNARNKSYISLLIKSFEMYKNASQYARERVSRTGELDTRKLHRFQMTNDIFRKVTTTEKGKSHGMVLYLDMSGSMTVNFESSMEQILLLTAFCKAVNIPFEVYGFCNSASRGYQRFFTAAKKFNSVQGQTLQFAETKHFHLKELITSKMNVREYKKAFEMLLIASKYIGGDYYYRGTGWSPSIKKYASISFNKLYGGFDMNSTPFMEATVCSLKMIEEFRAKYHSDIVNVVYVSDGAGDQSAYLERPYETHQPGTKIIIREKKSNEKVVYRKGELPMQTLLTELVKKATGVQHIGFYLCNSNRDLSGCVDRDAYSRASSRFRNDGFVEMPSMGYDSYYFVNVAFGKRAGGLHIDKDENASKMAKKFAKSQTNKHASRAILAKFAKQVAA
jgi:hypothetical protein